MINYSFVEGLLSFAALLQAAMSVCLISNMCQYNMYR